MNSIPASSNTFLSSSSDCVRLGGTRSWLSNFNKVCRLMPAAWAARSAVQFSKARADRICPPVNTISLYKKHTLVYKMYIPADKKMKHDIGHELSRFIELRRRL